MTTPFTGHSDSSHKIFYRCDLLFEMHAWVNKNKCMWLRKGFGCSRDLNAWQCRCGINVSLFYLLLECMCHTWLSFLKLQLWENDTGVRMMSQHEKSREAFPVIIHLSTSHLLAEIWTRWPNMSPLPPPSVILWVMEQYRRSTVSLLAVAERQGTKNACTS